MRYIKVPTAGTESLTTENIRLEATINIIQLLPACPALGAYSSRSAWTNDCPGNILPLTTLIRKIKQQYLLVINTDAFGIAIMTFVEYTANPETSLKICRNSNQIDLAKKIYNSNQIDSAIKNITVMNSYNLINY
jgi:hypothetical protein